MKWLQTPEVFERFFFFLAMYSYYNVSTKTCFLPGQQDLQIIFLVLVLFFLVAWEKEKEIKV